jgi:hypothetical protein
MRDSWELCGKQTHKIIVISEFSSTEKVAFLSHFVQKRKLAIYQFLLSTYEIWKVLISLAKKKIFFIANFHVLGLFIPKKRV